MADESGQGHRQRIKERFLAGDGDSRSDKALLELLLTYAIPLKDVQPIAEGLLTNFGTLSAVLEASPSNLCNFEGIKSHTLVLLKLVDSIRSRHPFVRTKQSATEEPQAHQMALFDKLRKQETEATPPSKESRTRPHRKVIPRRGTEMFGKAILAEAIKMLPELPDSDSLDEIREYLRKNLPFNAEQTRQRNANYIIQIAEDGE